MSAISRRDHGQLRPNSASNLKGGLTPTTCRRQDISTYVQGSVDGKNPGEDVKSQGQRTKLLMTHAAIDINWPKWDVTPGTMGIHNHGNTCFMNTVLQCLSNTDLFSEYFIKEKYKVLDVKDKSKSFFGSTKAETEVCDHLGALIKSLWLGNYNQSISSNLKSVVSKYNEQYKGSSQHDAQEFMLWLLDRINEERHVSSKKKVNNTHAGSKKDKHQALSSDCSSPDVVAAIASGFDVYNRFQALYQSTLKCPRCERQSNTYESYMCLSLPVPQKCLRPVLVTVIYLDNYPKQLKIALEINVMGTIKELRENLEKMLEVSTKRLVLCQIHENGFQNTFSDDQPLSDIGDNENIYAFETLPLDKVNKTPDSDFIQILLVHIVKLSSSKCFRICNPEVIKVERDINFIKLQRCILKSMGLAISSRMIERSSTFNNAIFDIRVMDCGPTDTYLPSNVEMPLYTEAIDRALCIYGSEFGPLHVKFVIEWDPETKKRIIVNDEEHIEEHVSVHKARLGQQQPSCVTLEDCLNLFTKTEQLGDVDAWNCPYCHQVQPGTTKKMGLLSSPDILVIHLKRFSQCGSKRIKLNILVNFPITDLEMGRHLIPKDDTSDHVSELTDLYDLYAITNHYGTMNGGHYTALCKNPVDFKWYEFDDTNVRQIGRKEIVTRAAYLLFYQRKKLIRESIEKLLSDSHWVFLVTDPPRSVVFKDSAISEDVRLPGKSSEAGMRKTIERDIEQGSGSQSSLSTLELILQEEARSLELLKINRHRNDINSPNSEGLKRDVTSPQTDEMGINSSRQQVRHNVKESPRRALFNSENQNSFQINNLCSLTENALVKDTVPVAAAETSIGNRHLDNQVGSSRQLGDQVDSWLMSTGTLRNQYYNSDNLGWDNLYALSGREPAIHIGHSPASVLNALVTPDSVGSYQGVAAPSEQTSLLNKERNVNLINGNSSSSTRLKLTANQTHKVKNIPKTNQKSESKNQKVPNVTSSKSSANEFPTPQQQRKSPSPPVLRNQPWSTPQPQQKQISEKNMSIGRQDSVPPVKPRSVSSYDGYNLVAEDQTLREEPAKTSSNETMSAITDKPPLPKSSQSSAINDSKHNNTTSSSSYSNNRLQSLNDSSPLSTWESRAESHTGRGNGPAEGEGKRVLAQRTLHRGRNRSADRQLESRRSVRVTNERALSNYHHDNYNDQYYLTQPIEGQVNFDRVGRYATMHYNRRHEFEHHYQNESKNVHLPSDQSIEHMHSDYTNKTEEPRSRAPISYSPQYYHDSIIDTSHYFSNSHYQPHMHSANMMSRMALKDKHYLERKTKSNCLKESSV